LWATDGSTAGTNLFKDIYPGPHESAPRNLTVVNDKLFFSAEDEFHHEELWVTDGTPEGTEMVKDIVVGDLPSFPGHFAASNNILYFVPANGDSGGELWRSEGTEASTQLVKDINPTGPAMDMFSTNRDIDGTLFFVADDGSHGTEIWKTDGTEVNTVRVTDVNEDSGDSAPRDLVNFNSLLFFTATNGSSRNIYFYENDAISLLKDIPAGMSGGAPQGLTVSGNKLYFKANKNLEPYAIGGLELWVSDGTESGTAKIKDIHPDPNTSSQPGNLTDVNGILFFTADDGSHGVELWKSDGTAANTVLVKDINFGSDSSSPSSLTSLDGRVYFYASTPESGRELWQSDGTPEGTKLVADVNLGTGGSDSEGSEVGKSGSELFISANDGNTGEELWMLTDSAPVVLKVNNGTGTGNDEIEENGEETLYLTQLLIIFDQAVVNVTGSESNDAANPANYLLFTKGGDDVFDTFDCATGLSTDDVGIAINGASYNQNSLTATIFINNTDPLPPDAYRLLVCGTTSIENSFGDKLDGDENGSGGDDFIRNFTVVEDSDQDGVKDLLDNCLTMSNADQQDTDSDGVGDICDNCEEESNVDQLDSDYDQIGDVCDNCQGFSNFDQLDGDNDLIGDVCDVCPTTFDAGQEDSDSDGVGDACDNCKVKDNEDQSNQDSDSFGDVCDNCPAVDNKEQTDTDNDGLGDACDADDDNDDIPDTWEIANKLDPLDSSDRDLDPDKDQFSNYDEYVNGTDPQSADQQLMFSWSMFLPAITGCGR